MLGVARKEAEKRGLPVFAETSNPRRRAKGGAWLTVASERAGYIPAGYMIRLGGLEHVRITNDYKKNAEQGKGEKQATS